MTTKYCIASSAYNASDDTVWSLSSGGANDTTAPGITDKAVWDSGCTANGVMDILALDEVEIVNTFNNEVDQTSECTVLAAFLGNYGTGKWNHRAALYVQGDYSDLGSGTNGFDSTTSDPIYLAGSNITVTRNSSNILRYNNANIVGDINQFDLPKTHNVHWNSGKPQFNNGTIADNQTITIVGASQIGNCVMGNNVTFQDDGTARGLTFDGLIPNLHNVTFNSTAVNRLDINFELVNIVGADFGRCEVTVRESGDFYGNWITTGKFRFRNSGVQSITMKAGSSLTIGEFQIGHETNPARQTDLTQEAGASVNVTGQTILNQDDTVVVSRWTREAGSEVYIGGQLIIENDADLAWSAITDFTEIGGFNFTSSSNIPSNQRFLIVGDDSVISQNANFANRDIIVKLAPSKYLRTSGNVYLDDLIGPDSGVAYITGGGQILLRTYTQGERVTVISNTDGDLQFSYANGPIRAYDYGNAEVSGPTGTTVSGGVNHLKCYRLNVFRLTQNTTTTYTATGDVDCTITVMAITNIDTRGGHFIWDSTGRLTIGTLQMNDANETTAFTVFQANVGSGKIVINTLMDLQTKTTLDIQGASAIDLYGNIDVDAGGSVDFGASTVTLLGASDQTIDMNGESLNRVINQKSGGTTTFTTACDITSNYVSRPLANTNTILTVGVAFTLDHFDFANVANTAKETFDSSDGATPVAVTNAAVGPTGYNTDVGRIALSTGTQNMDNNTCSDLGGNTNFNFDDFPDTSAAGNGSREVSRQVSRASSRPFARNSS